jgi:hypothetical protein
MLHRIMPLVSWMCAFALCVLVALVACPDVCVWLVA